MFAKCKVVWFDKLNGIGLGITTDNKEVFLNCKYVKPNGNFITLENNEMVDCNITKNKDGSLYADTIIRDTTKLLRLKQRMTQ